MSHTLVKTVAVIAIAVLSTACNPVLRTHGYIPTANKKPQEVNPETDTKAESGLKSHVRDTSRAARITW